jgi:hemerythrin superfamily protein
MIKQPTRVDAQSIVLEDIELFEKERVKSINGISTFAKKAL